MPAASEARTLAIEVVDEQQLARRTAHALKEDSVDARIRLGDAEMARDDAHIEFVQEWAARPRDLEFLGREIAQRVNRTAGRAQALQYRHVLLDRAPERLDPPRVEKLELFGELGKGFRALRNRPREIGDDVGMRNKFHAAGSSQKTLHPRLVAEHLAEQIAPIPAHQDVADVKDDDQGMSSPEGCGQVRDSRR